MDIRRVPHYQEADYLTMTTEAPSCYYDKVNYASPAATSSVLLDTLRFTPQPSVHNSELSIFPNTPHKPITANLQHGLYMFPSRRTGTHCSATVEPVDFICMQIKGMKKKVVEGQSVVYSDATVGIFTGLKDGPLKRKGTHHLEIARNMNVTVSKNDGTWTLDARTEGGSPIGNLENASVFKGRRVYKEMENGNTLVWNDMYGSWTGLVDVTNETAEGLWPALEWPRPSLIGTLAEQAACGAIVDYNTTGSTQLGGGVAVTALSSLTDLVEC